MNTAFRKWSTTAVLALLMAAPSALAQGRVTLDFETNGSLDDFEFFGFGHQVSALRADKEYSKGSDRKTTPFSPPPREPSFAGALF